jgi:antitoxin ParD1/3/4
MYVQRAPIVKLERRTDIYVSAYTGPRKSAAFSHTLDPYRKSRFAQSRSISTEVDIRQSNSPMAYYANCCFSRVVAMPTRNVVLTDYQAELVEQLVASGRYQNASEVLRDGLRLVEIREAEDKARLKALRDAARIGIADMGAGRFRSFDSPDAIRSHLTAIASEAIAEGVPESRSA